MFPALAASGNGTLDHSSFSGAASCSGNPQLVRSVAYCFSSFALCPFLSAFSSPSWSPCGLLPLYPLSPVSPALYAFFPGCFSPGGCVLAFTLLPDVPVRGCLSPSFLFSPSSRLCPPCVAPHVPVCDIRPLVPAHDYLPLVLQLLLRTSPLQPFRPLWPFCCCPRSWLPMFRIILLLSAPPS